MEATVGYILCCQSPALFLAAAVLLLCFFARRSAHRVRAVLDLVVCILAAACGVMLYFLGMGRGHFTISDFYIIRTPGWVGLVIVAVLSVWAGIRAFARLNRRRQAEKEANRAANAQHFEGEQQEKAANEAAAAGVAQVVAEAVETPAVSDNRASVCDTETDAVTDEAAPEEAAASPQEAEKV